MRFLSIEFVIFIVLLLFILSKVKQEKIRQSVLLVASYLFYAYADYRFVALLLMQTIVAFLFAIMINKKIERGTNAKLELVTGLLLSIGILTVIKYSNFFIESLPNKVGGGTALNIIVPIGISFYTLQAVSYMVDVYQGKQNAYRSFKNVALYVGFFPQITSGPIVKAHDFFRQLEQEHSVKLCNIAEGAQIFLMGVVKKTVIADRLGRAVDAVYAAPNAYSGWSIILTTIAYSVQIYCDFSGYSDMAIGVAKALGYDLGKNFNVPYIAHNPSEFWHRWHISLSSWFREYVYFPLGGSRKGLRRTCFNLFLVMLLSGLWHGAGWTYILWGIYHGVGIMIHKCFTVIVSQKRRHIESDAGRKVVRGFSIAVTFLFVNVGWILFRADNIETVRIILYRILTLADGVEHTYIYTFIFALLILAINIYVLTKQDGKATYVLLDYDKFSSWFILWSVILLTLMFFYPGQTEFIYGQF